MSENIGDLISISNSPIFAKMNFYKDKNGVYYPNFKSEEHARELSGNEGIKYFKEQKNTIEKHNAKKLNETETLSLIRQTQLERDYNRQHYA